MTCNKVASDLTGRGAAQPQGCSGMRLQSDGDDDDDDDDNNDDDNNTTPPPPPRFELRTPLCSLDLTLHTVSHC